MEEFKMNNGDRFREEDEDEEEEEEGEIPGERSFKKYFTLFRPLADPSSPF